MSDRFDLFVLFAEMRTGSNFLETNLNALDGVTCHGEAFNPSFPGYPNAQDVLGVTMAERDAHPLRLLDALRDAPGLNGFRYFHDHEPRVLGPVLDNPRCAKIVLTRNPAESYVSRKIAQATDQWKLTNVAKRRDAKAVFDAQEFEAHLEQLQAFQVTLLNALQVRGQTAFYIAYEDLQDLRVLNGLAAYLGVTARLEAPDEKLKRQNPAPIADKVENFADMQAALARLDRFDLTRTPNFEPRRAPAVPSYVAAARTPLLYLPIRSGPEQAVRAWLAALDGVGEGDLPADFNQKTLRQWKRERPGHRAFTVVRHPLARAHDAFCTKVLDTGPGSFAGIRKTLIRAHGVPLPDGAPGDDWDVTAHRTAFVAFLRFLKANLAGQTGIRVDGHWASQARVLEGFAEFALPDMIVREDEVSVYLPALAQQVGHQAPPDPEKRPNRAPHALAAIYDDEIESLGRAAYGRDYVMFGFDDWM